MAAPCVARKYKRAACPLRRIGSLPNNRSEGFAVMTTTTLDELRAQGELPLLGDARLEAELAGLYAQAVQRDPTLREAALAQGIAENDPRFYGAMREAAMPVTPAFGKLLYVLVRATGARTVVEYGTSLGISTLFLAAALRDNGGGHLLTTELEPRKMARAREHLERAGLAAGVEWRQGDALQTLRDGVPPSIDLLLLDGAKSQYLAVLKMLEPHLAPGALVAADNSDWVAAGDFLAWVRNPARGYVSAAVATHALGGAHGHEIVLRSGRGPA